MKAIRYILTLALFAAVNSVFGQDLTARAHALYQAKDYDSAKVWIDSAVVSKEKTNSQTWQLHGLIYRKLETPANPGYREVAINSFLEARRLDSANIYKTQITDYLSNTIIRYYNDAVNQLNEGRFAESERS